MMRTFVIALFAASASVAPVLATGGIKGNTPPASNKGDTPPNLPNGQPKFNPSAPTVQHLTQRAANARVAHNAAVAAYQKAVQAHQALIAKHAPLLKERERRRADLLARGAQTDSDVKRNLPGAKERRAAYERDYKAYDAAYKTPAIKALKEIADAEAVANFTGLDASNKKADLQKEVRTASEARIAAARKAKEIRDLERQFAEAPPLPLDTPIIFSGASKVDAPRTVDAVPVADPANAGRPIKSGTPVAVVADSADVSTSANPVTPVGQPAAVNSPNAPRKRPVNRVFQRLPAAPASSFDTLYEPAPPLDPGPSQPKPLPNLPK